MKSETVIVSTPFFKLSVIIPRKLSKFPGFRWKNANIKKI